MKHKEYVPTLRELLDIAPEKFNDKTFISYKKGDEVIEVSFSRFRNDALAFCRKIRNEYPGRNHFAVFSKNSYEYIVSLFGIILSGNVIVPSAPDMSVADAVSMINNLDITAVLYENDFSPVLEKILEECDGIKYTLKIGEDAGFGEIYEKYSDSSCFAELSEIKTNPDDYCLIISTSGTTGDRKGVMLSEYALVGNVVYTPYSETITGAYKNLCVLPLYHILCFVADIIGPLKLGCTVCLNGSMRDLFANLLLFKPESMRTVPMIAQAILGRINAIIAKNPEMDKQEAVAQVTGGKLKVLMSGGAYLDPALCKAFDSFGIFLRQGYGMSEAGCKVTLPDEYCDIESVGRVMEILSVRIRDNEVQIDTPCVMKGYYKNEQATKDAFTEDGWLKTGDIGRLTEDGQLFITGRLKNLIILSNGENVSPEGIENRYRCHKIVKEVLVYAEKDMIIAEIYPDADVAEHSGITDIKAEINRITDELNLTALPSHTVAKVIIRNEPLPKTAIGKITRK